MAERQLSEEMLLAVKQVLELEVVGIKPLLVLVDERPVPVDPKMGGPGRGLEFKDEQWGGGEGGGGALRLQALEAFLELGAGRPEALDRTGHLVPDLIAAAHLQVGKTLLKSEKRSDGFDFPASSAREGGSEG